VRALAASGTAVAAVGAYVQFDEKGNRKRGPHPRRTVERRVWKDVVFHWGANPSRVLFRTEVIRKLGGFTEGVRLREDWELWLRVAREGTVVFIPQLILEYRIHAGQRVMDDERNVVDSLRASHGSTLPPADAAVLERIGRARRSYLAGSDALSTLDARDAARALSGVVRTEPWILASPISRPLVVRPLAKALVGIVVGRRGTLAIRRAAAAVRKATRRDARIAPARASDPHEDGS
jgi:hypothetical protein